MQIIEGKWNRFRIPFKQEDNESEEDYLTRVKNLLIEFYNTHTRYDGNGRELLNPLNHIELASLKEEGNFCYMGLEGIAYCNVKYFVGTREDNYGNIGIDVLSHAHSR